MVKFIISVKKDRLNEHLLEGDHDFLSFLDILDKYTVTIDTLSNFSIFINYEIRIPVYLSALRVLKSHSNNEEIIGKELPIWQYVKGYNQGFQTDITPGINKMEYHIENIITIFESKIQAFHFDNSYNHFDESGMLRRLGIMGFSDDLWFEYGIQIGKEKQAWDAILKDPDQFIAYFENKSKIISQKTSINDLYEKIVEIKRILLIEGYIENDISLVQPEKKQNFSSISNNFDKTPIHVIYAHFKTGLIDKKYLNEKELFDYLKSAFEDKVIPQTLFKFKNAPEKQKIMKVYYQYYKDLAGKPHGKQKDYAALLGDYFEGYNTENVRTNFNK